MTNAKVVTVARSQSPEFVFTEAHLNGKLLIDNGIIKRAIVNLGLDKLLFQHPTSPEGVIEFFTNLDPQTLKTKIGLHKTGEHGLTYLVAMDDLEFDILFDNVICVYNRGEDPESTGDSDIQKEFRQFSANPWEIYDMKKRKVTALRPPYNHLANIITKCLLCHTDGWQKLTEQKIHLMVTLCDAAMHHKVYNWKAWFTNQLLEAKKWVEEIKEGEDKEMFTFHGKLKFGMKVSIFLKQSWPGTKNGPQRGSMIE